MPNVTMPDGTVIYDVPEGTTQTELLSRLRASGRYDMDALMRPATVEDPAPAQPELEKSPIEDVLEEVPLVGDFLSGTADVGLGVVQGLAGVTGAATEAFGADSSVSNVFERIARGAQSLMSAEERGDLAEGQRIMQEAEDAGILEQVKAAARAFAKSPLTLSAQAVGSALPFIGATIATGGGAAAPLALGAVTGAGVVKGSIYDAVEAEALKEGLTQEQAAAMADAAQAYGGENLDMIALGTVLGGVAGRLGIEGAFAKSIGNKVARGAIATFAAEASTEALQAGQERLAGNLAAQRAGYDVPLGRGVAGQAALEGIMGGVPGAAVGAIKGRAEATAEEIEEAQKLYEEAVAAKTETVEDEEGRAYIEAETARLVNEIGYDPENAASVAADQWATIQRARKARDERVAERAEDGTPESDTAEQLELPFGRGVEPSVPAPSGGPAAQPQTTEQLELPFGRGVDAGSPDVSVDTGGVAVSQPPLIDMSQPRKARTAQALPIAKAGARREEFAGLDFTEKQILQVKNKLAQGQFLDGPDPVRAAFESVLTKGQKEIYAPTRQPTVETTPAPQTKPEVTPEQPAPVEEAPKGAAEAPVEEEEEAVVEEAAAEEAAAEEAPAEEAPAEEAAAEEVAAEEVSAEEAPAEEAPAEEAAPVEAPAEEAAPVEAAPVEAAPEQPAPVEAAPEQPAPVEAAPVIEEITEEERATAEGLAGGFGGIVPFITRSAPGETAIGLVRGTNPLNGGPIYVPFKGDLRFRVDVDSKNINPKSAGMTEEELALLRKAKRDIEAEDAAKHKADPFVKYDADGLSFSSSVPEALRNTIRGWKRLLLPGVKIYITDTADIVIDKYKFTGQHRKVQSAALDPDEAGSTRRIGPGEHYLAVALTSLAGDPQAILETVAHEMGHIHDKESFQNASPEIQQKLRQEHRKWLTKNTAKDKTAADLVKALRAPAMGKMTEAPDIPASQLTAYWKSFSEWYADQMARWATSNEKPLSVVDKFFKSVVDKLRAFYRTARGQGYLPNETFKQFVESTTDNLDLSDTDVAEETDVVKAADAALMAEQISLDDFEAIQNAAESGKFDNKRLFKELDRRKKQFLNRASFAKTTAAKATVDAAKKADEALEKVRAAGDRDSKELPRKMQSAFREQKLRNQIRSLPFVGAVASDSSFRVLLGSLPTTGLLNYADVKLGKQITANLRRAMNFVERMYADRLRMMRRLSIPVKQLFDHQKKFGNIVMSDAMNYARATNIDMTAFKPGMSEQQAFNTDLVLRYLERLVADPDNATRKRLGQIELRKQQLRRAMMLWDALGKQGNGQKIYADIRNMYRNLYQVRRNALERSLKSWGVPGANRILKQMQLELEKIDERIKPPAEGEGHPQYPDVPLGLFPREYFPYKRFGNYYVRVEKGPAGEPATYFAENEQKRDAKAAELIAQGYAISSRGLVSEDYNVRDDLAGSAVFEKAVTIINQLDPEKTTQATKESLNEELYNLYLMTLPDAVRQRFIKSKNRTGYSSDVARVAATTATEYANEIAKLDYRNQINAAISQARDAAEKLEGEEGMTPTQEDNLKAFAAEVEARANNTISPTSTNNAITKGIRGATQLAFMAFLTAPATALVNTTALPVRVQPRLWREYKFNDVNNMLTKYATTWRVLPKPRQTDSGSALQHVPSVADNPMVKNNPVLLRAYNRANNRYSLFEGMASVIMENEPTPDVVGDRLNTAKRVASNVATYLFDVSEKLSRETAYMTAFELEYNKLKKEGKLDQLEIEEAATEKAKDIVYDTLFNYNAYNRPRFANQSELAKAVFQFKMYAVETLRFLVESGVAVIRGQRGLDGPTRLEAFKELAGVFLMAGMFGGLANSFLSLPIVALALLASGIGDDEDDEISSLLKDYDMDAWFANEYLPEHLGGPAFEGADGESYSVADLVLRGPLSVATGMNFGSRVNLDPRTLLIHTQVQGDTISEKVQNAIIDNIPGASAGFDVMAAFEDIAKGEVLDGVVKGLPLALVRQPLKAYRFGTKGYISSSGKEKLSRDDLETYQLMGVAFGLNPLELAQLQEKQSVQFGIKDKYGGARSELMGRLNKTRRMVASGTKSEEDIQDIYAEIREHNEEMQRIGAFPYIITGEDIMRSLRGIISEGRYDIDGMSLNRDEAILMSNIFPKE